MYTSVAKGRHKGAMPSPQYILKFMWKKCHFHTRIVKKYPKYPPYTFRALPPPPSLKNPRDPTIYVQAQHTVLSK